VWTSLEWLIARPFAHRGLLMLSTAWIENTPSAVRRQSRPIMASRSTCKITADGEAMVHHDDCRRLTYGEGRSTAHRVELKRVPFAATEDRMMNAWKLCEPRRRALTN